MRYFITKKKRIAVGLLTIIGLNTLFPAVSFALTSGPTQPETKGFQPAGVSDMVDVQSGSFKYNIPLLDIDGYPINLNYQSGVGMDDEASWVGLGWSLTPGAINRQVRGIPDDFSGDLVETDHYTKPKVTVGGRATAKVEVFGKSGLSGSFTFGVFSDNYTGIGAEFGVNAGISFSRANDGFLTAGLGVGVLSNTQSGVDVTPYVSLALKNKVTNDMTARAGLTGSLGYNTRSGMKGLTLGTSFGGDMKKDGELDKNGNQKVSHIDGLFSASSSISYNTPAISPTIQTPYRSRYTSYSFDVGAEIWGTFPGFGGTGYQNSRYVEDGDIVNKKPAFGFLYAERGKNNADAVMDFIREKDNPIIPEIPNIALPIHTPDLWTYTSQTGGGQFRIYRGGSGVFFDNQLTERSTVGSFGVDLGFGSYVHGGVTLFKQNTLSTTSKWKDQNLYMAAGDFQDESTTEPDKQHAYFKLVGEKGLQDSVFANKVYDTNPLAVLIQGTYSFPGFKFSNSTGGLAQPNKSTTRRLNRTIISYLTAGEAAGALDADIKMYPVNDAAGFTLPANNKPVHIASATRLNANTKTHHISEVSITDEGGKRMVYGIPVYNLTQDEYTFAVGKSPVIAGTKNEVTTPSVITGSKATGRGIDEYYHKESKPAYASSFLLTAILSPDYVDRTGNGISDDDLGTAIKFNYSKTSTGFKWRTPYQNSTLNRSMLADPDDDKGSIVFGTKELWFVSSIETKTKVVYFITQDRRDGLGVTDWLNGGRDLAQKQKLLSEIRIYSKSDRTRPIKVVKFQYNYELCKGIPNSADFGDTDPAKGGKLTLKRVWFEYGNSDKGKYHPYVFEYNKATTGIDITYANMAADRWGQYKNGTDNANGLDNEFFPYSLQGRTVADKNAALWHVSQISLPTGGTIKVDYEAGDYAYVQNKKAMVMTGIQSLISSPGVTVASNQLNRAKGVSINIGTSLVPPGGADQTRWFKDNFLNGSDYLYAKYYVKMSTGVSPSYECDYDYVPVYSRISYVTITSGVANVMFADLNEAGLNMNPVSIAAWQRLKNEYPRYAYPGFDNRVRTESSSIMAAVSAIVQAAANMSELKENFYQKANKRGYASQVDLGKSFAKIIDTDGFKLGGSTRVKKIRITDEWQSMTTAGDEVGREYGQAYSYTTIEQGRTISSGVATYEPSIGNDENPLKEPVVYGQQIKGGINNYYSLEKPFGESLYPSPSIGYSKVTVNDLDESHNASNKTGAVVNEFYTAKDFPVRVSVLPITSISYKPSSSFSLTRTNSEDDLTLSQGYSIELNDMHGKPKATTVLNQGGSEVSSTTYYYKQNSKGELDNRVDVINENGILQKDKIIGRDMEFFTDFREQKTTNKGEAINIGLDVIPIIFGIPLPIPHWPKGDNNENKQFRSACAVKVVQTYGIADRVVKRQNGSSITTQNVAYDRLTGEPLVTKTQNEFNGDIYSVNLPAYWVYNGMGGAYKNLGVYLSAFTTNTNGEVKTAYANYMRAGDEILDVASGDHYWVIDNAAVSGGGTTKKLISRDGTMKKSYTATGLIKILRSGYRNILTASTGSIMCLSNPLATISGATRLQITNNADLTSLKVINASATTFDEDWQVVSAAGLQPSDYTPGSTIYPLFSDPTLGTFTTANVALYNYNNQQETYTYSTPTTSYFKTFDHVNQSAVKAQDHAGSIIFYDVIVDTCITITTTQQYNIGLLNCVAYIDNIEWGTSYHTYAQGEDWSITANRSIGYLQAGQHRLRLMSNTDFGPHFSAEIYGNTVSQITSATTLSGLNVVFSANSFRNKASVRSGYTTYNGSFIYVYRYYGNGNSALDPCEPVKGPPKVNPYLSGNLGNWRQYQTKVFQQNRKYADPFNVAQKSLDIKNAGSINRFRSYWYNSSGAWLPNDSVEATQNWVTANTVSLYDKYGQQLENKDALNRYSAAKFDFNGELPSAVASNAANREIYMNSLEDVRFVPGTVSTTDPLIREFIRPSTGAKISTLYDTLQSHSGNYSVKLPSDGLKLSTIVHTAQHKTNSYLALDASKQYMAKADTGGLYPNGFEPYPGKEYLFNAWVKDAQPNNKSVNLALKLNGSTVTLTCKAVVEGWKLMEGKFTTGSSGAQIIEIIPNSGQTIYMDDIRIHPFDAHIKTYAYDDKTLRLMAELDENGFATFYEYDDEGLLVRVKKETERGIMTIKESRSSYTKKTN